MFFYMKLTCDFSTNDLVGFAFRSIGLDVFAAHIFCHDFYELASKKPGCHNLCDSGELWGDILKLLDIGLVTSLFTVLAWYLDLVNSGVLKNQSTILELSLSNL